MEEALIRRGSRLGHRAMDAQVLHLDGQVGGQRDMFVWQSVIQAWVSYGWKSTVYPAVNEPTVQINTAFISQRQCLHPLAICV